MSERRATICDRTAVTRYFPSDTNIRLVDHDQTSAAIMACAKAAGLNTDGPCTKHWDMYTDAWFVVEGTEKLTDDEMHELRLQDGTRWITFPEKPWSGVIGQPNEVAN
jgi:hypothetical protein